MSDKTTKNERNPGDGVFWEQIKRNGDYEYVFYQRPSALRKTDGLVFNDNHSNGDPDNPINYVPVKKSFWADMGEPAEPSETLWNDIRQFVFDHIEFSDERLYDVKTAWILCTWIPEMFTVSPYWRYLGQKNSGKTRGLEIDQQLCYRAVLTPSISEAALYRLIEEYKITYLLDETEHYNNDTKVAIQNVLNSGYRRGQQAIRCTTAESGKIIVEGYATFGFKSLAGTRPLKGTLESRCILTVMQKNVRPVKFYVDAQRAKKLRNQLLMWRFRQLDKLLDDNSEVSEGSEGSEGHLEAPKRLHSIGNSRIVELYSSLLRIAPDDVKDMIADYAYDSYRINQEEEGTTSEAEIFNAILLCRNDLISGKFSTKMVTTFFNEGKPDREHWKSRGVGKVIKTLGFEARRMTGGASGYVYDQTLIDRLNTRFEAVSEGEVPPLGQTSLGSLTSLTSLKDGKTPNLNEKIKAIVELLGDLDNPATTQELFDAYHLEIGVQDLEELEKIILVMARDNTIYSPDPGYWELS